MNQKMLSYFYKIAAILWVIWGIVHVFAGVMTISSIFSGDISMAINGIADAVPSTEIQMDYPAALGAILGQHGFNLLWFGLVTLGCAFFVWNGSRNAIILAALVGGLADLGYFLFLDLGGYVHFVPGTVMTLVSASAIILSFYALFQGEKMPGNKN